MKKLWSATLAAGFLIFGTQAYSLDSGQQIQTTTPPQTTTPTTMPSDTLNTGTTAGTVSGTTSGSGGVPIDQASPSTTTTTTTSPSATTAGTLAPSNAATLDASLVAPEVKARQKSATVEVRVTGVQLVDPASSNEIAKPGQAHLHYQLDQGPMIATPADKLSFHGLTSGDHQITVMLAGNDHTPLGPSKTLKVSIPQ